MNPPKIICPACGLDAIEPIVGGFLCCSCGHVFAVVNGQVRDLEEEDDDAPDPAA